MAAIRHRPIVPVTAAFVLGVLCAEHSHISLGVWLVAAVAALAAAALARWRWGGRRATSAALMIAVLLGAGAWHVCRRETGRTIRRFCLPKRQCVRVRGMVIDPPVRRARLGCDRRIALSSSYMLEATAIKCNGAWTPVSGKLKCTVYDPGLALDRRDIVEVLGWLYALRRPTNPGQFDYARYAARHGVVGGLYSPVCDNIRVLGHRPGNPGQRLLSWLRRRVRASLREELDDTSFAIAAQMLLGDRGRLPRREREAFQRTGTVHYLAISGLHTGLMAALLWMALHVCGVSHTRRAGIVLAFLISYGALVGWRPSVTRSVVMMGALFSAPLVRRVWDRTSAICAAVLVILLLNPADLFNPGFHLSLAGVLGIVLISGRLEALLFPDRDLEMRFKGSEEWSFLRHTLPHSIGSALSVSLGAWLGILPLTAFYFHLSTPLVAVFNLVAGALVWVQLSAGMLLVLSAGLAGPVVGPIVRLATVWLQSSVWFFERIPGSYWYVVGPTALWVFIYYGALWLWLERDALGLRTKHLLIGALALANAFVLANRPVSHPDEMRATMLDVGHGLAVVVEFPDGRNLLYDVGSGGSFDVGSQVVAPALWASRIRGIDVVVLSHADTDHNNGLRSLAARVPIGRVVTSAFFAATRTGKRIVAWAAQRGIPMTTTGAGDRIALSASATVDVLNPPRAGGVTRLLKSNDRSVVLRIEFAGHSLLLTGDALTAAWTLARENSQAGPADVALVPHHGGRFAGAADFVHRWVKSIAIASNHRRDMSAAMQSACRAAGVELLQTADHGALRARFSSRGVALEAFRDGGWRPVNTRPAKP